MIAPSGGCAFQLDPSANQQTSNERQQRPNTHMENSILLALFTFFLGALVTHRLTFWRDRRNDFNKIAQPIRAALIEERDRASPFCAGLGAVEADQLHNALPCWRRKSFNRAWEGYRQAKQETRQDNIGGVAFCHPNQVVRQIETLLRFTAPR